VETRSSYPSRHRVSFSVSRNLAVGVVAFVVAARVAAAVNHRIAATRRLVAVRLFDDRVLAALVRLVIVDVPAAARGVPTVRSAISHIAAATHLVPVAAAMSAHQLV